MDNPDFQQHQQSMLRPAGRRNFRRNRSYTLKQAIAPKTCGMLSGSGKQEKECASGFMTGRVIYVLCGMLFVGAGLYNVLF